MQTKIVYVSVAAVAAVAVTIIAAASATGMSGLVYSSYVYDPFDDPAYAHNAAPFGIYDNRYTESYSGNKTMAHSHASFPLYTFEAIVDMAAVIAIGNVTNKEDRYFEETVGDITAGYVSSFITVAVDQQLKGKPTQELQYYTMGGETETMITPSYGFLPESGDQVLILLTTITDPYNSTVYTPITLDGEYMILNGTQVARYGEPVTVPLKVFVDLIRELLA